MNCHFLFFFAEFIHFKLHLDKHAIINLWSAGESNPAQVGCKDAQGTPRAPKIESPQPEPFNPHKKQEAGMTAEIEKSKISREIPRGIPGVHISPGIAKKREIANYPVGPGLKARIIFSGESLITTESIEKLIKLLDLNKKDLPEKILDEEKSD